MAATMIRRATAVAGATRWRTLVPERKRLVIWGASHQARVNKPILESLGCEIVAFIDDTPGLQSPCPPTPLFSELQAFESWLSRQNVSTLGFVIAVSNPAGDARCRLHDLMSRFGLYPISFADETASVCRTATLGSGLQVMPHAIIHNDAVVGRQCLLNTRSLVEHDCVLEDGVEIGPGAILCGRVRVDHNGWIGAGATVLPWVRIGRNAIVGAGAVVVSDVPENVTVVGVPAKPIDDKNAPATLLVRAAN